MINLKETEIDQNYKLSVHYLDLALQYDSLVDCEWKIYSRWGKLNRRRLFLNPSETVDQEKVSIRMYDGLYD